MKTPHTPGPWAVNGYDITAVRTAYKSEGLIAKCNDDRIDIDTRIANAKLIAAAPDMLAALDEVRKLSLTTEPGYEVCTKAIELAIRRKFI